MDPSRLALLYQDEDDGKVLETDVMRFMAIVGIVFWMLFALVKSLPLQENRPSNIAQQKTATSDASDSTSQRQESVLPPDTDKPDKAEKPDKFDRKPEASQPGPQKVLTVNFSSTTALEKLVQTNRVEIYFATRSTAFNLVFKSIYTSGTIKFKGINTSSLPGSLWEITSGVEYTYFSNLLKESEALAKSSDEQHLYIHFLDKKIEHRIEKEISELKQQKRYGKIRIHADGSVKFYENK